MKKYFIVIYLFFVSAVLFAASLYVPDVVPQGGIITVYIGGGRPDTLVALERDDVKLVKTHSFEYELRNRRIVIALIGVPTYYEEGFYRVTTDSGLEAKISITKQEFNSEDIHLTKTMTNLRKSDDVRKKTQSKKLSDILLFTDIEGVFERGNFEKPVTERAISSYFGDRRNYLYSDGTSARSIHSGIDYAASRGTPVFSCGCGRVVFADSRIITGLTVVIEHLPGVYSLYYHLESIDVEFNEMVKSGEKIGSVGSTGFSTGPHLHWEIRVAAVAVKPECTISSGIIDKSFILGIMMKH